MSTQPAPATSLNDLAYGELRRRIISCEIPPGAWATESKLALDLGVGKTPTREALARLAAEGFVRAIHRRGYQVVPITIAGVLEVFEAFSAVAPDVAALVTTRASTEERQWVARQARSWTPGVPGQGSASEGSLSLFLALTGNPTLIDMASGVIGQMERIFNFALRQDGLTDSSFHSAMEEALTALVGDDPELARTRFRALSEAGTRSVVASLQRTPSLMNFPLPIRPPVT